jgi:anti-sigma factor RsiW
MRAISRNARDPELYYGAPPYLESRIRAALRERKSPVISFRKPSYWRWAAAVACLILAAGLAWNLIAPRLAKTSQQTIADAVVSNHIRSLLAAHLFDVPSTDRHTVKPWFDGKLDFSPDVKDLADQGFRLTGGRLDYLDGRAVAALVFQRSLHVINLFESPSTEASGKPGVVQPGRQNGYNVVHWVSGGMSYWAVADIPVEELEEFGRIYGDSGQ